jgi:hypothetical protein
MPRKAELPIELIPKPESVQGGSNFLFVLAVLVLVIILGYFVYKLFNKFSEMSTDVALMKSVLIKITGSQEESHKNVHKKERVEEESIVEIEEEKPKEDNLEQLKENNSKLSDIDEEESD